MRLRLRLLLLVLGSWWRGRLPVLGESVLTLWVLPNDVDVTKITNDRYVALMDLGRMDIAFRVGLLKVMVAKRWAPLVTAVAMRYRHPLALLQRYRLRTRIVYWDERTFYFRQLFERRGRIEATGLVCATLLGPVGPVTPETIIAETGQTVQRPSPPEDIAQLRAMNDRLHQDQLEAERSGSLVGVS